MTTATTTKKNFWLRPVSFGTWIVCLLAIVGLVIGLNLLAAWRLDVFGLFRDTHGRALVTSEHERKQKYLLNRYYVPTNFDALIIGASASVNWRPDYLTGFHFYNESLEGGDASEERRLVDQSLKDGHFRLAIITLFPRITSQHVLQDGFDSATPREALGSISALGMEYDYLLQHVFRRHANAWPNGSHMLPPHAPPTVSKAEVPLVATQDPVAVKDYVDLAMELQQRHTQLLYVIVPLYQPYLAFNQAGVDSYTRTMLNLMPPAPVIDFNGPEYEWFRDDPSNYRDFVHLSAKGADTLSRLLNAQLVRLRLSPSYG